MARNKRKNRIANTLAVCFWLCAWQAASVCIGQKLILVSPLEVCGALLALLPTADFWQTAAFSAGRIIGGFLLALALGLALAALAVYFFWKKPSSWLERWVFILIFSGGLGNLIDRVLNGYVVDFFATTFMNFAVFNVADCFVCVGAALFVIAVLRQELNAKKEQKAGTDENA